MTELLITGLLGFCGGAVFGALLERQRAKMIAKLPRWPRV